MASIFDWSSTSSSNTTVEGVNIAEYCPAANVNNGIRSVMAIIKQTFSSSLQTFLAGTDPLAVANGGTGLTSLTSLYVPSGAVFHFAMSTAPSGYLKCNGAAVSRTTYADLFTAIGTTFGAGDGSTTFNLPELRGEFIRGWDNGRGADSGRAIGTYQADDFKSHTHPIAARSMAGGVAFGSTGGNMGQTTATDATGGTETRPRNIALLACIKI